MDEGMVKSIDAIKRMILTVEGIFYFAPVELDGADELADGLDEVGDALRLIVLAFGDKQLRIANRRG